MKSIRAFVCGAGIVDAAGIGLEKTWEALQKERSCLKPLSLFPVSHIPAPPAGELNEPLPADGDLPRTHAMALLAAREALSTQSSVPGAIVLGGTTGGISTTETLIRDGVLQPEAYRHHGLGTVAACLARSLKCRGPVITVSTACASGATALKIALELIRRGQAGAVLAGGADSLSRLTYYGFHSLQLIDPAGARPLDAARRGLTVAEGAAFLLLVGAHEPPEGALAELVGAGLSCDAHHPAAPHPEGAGALDAMRRALADAEMDAAAVDYINLHGTGTLENDLAEARAVRALFAHPPPLSSIKGIFGHSLGAAGAVEAVVSVLCIARGFIPSNAGCRVPDGALGLQPVLRGRPGKVGAVLSNSFGFGGNNAALVFARPTGKARRSGHPEIMSFSVTGAACLTGAGPTDETLEAFSRGETLRGRPDLGTIRSDLSAASLRRLRRLPRMALILALAAGKAAGLPEGAGSPGGIYFGTGWGPLTETGDFLGQLFASKEQFASPMDFIGSVHNAPASQAAIGLKATGPNITATGGDYSFEQALYSAALITQEGEAPVLVMAADEHHDLLSPRLDPAGAGAGEPADGGAAFLLKPHGPAAGPRLVPAFLSYVPGDAEVLAPLIEALGGPEAIRDRFGALFAGIPASTRPRGESLLADFLRRTAFTGPVIDYRSITGEFAAAAAVAAALAVDTVRRGLLPPLPPVNKVTSLNGKGILLLGLGEYVTGIEVNR
ncbi:MAG: beta-ketoacyl synthase N-terminal-like domain-containing protein [Thermodesulfobacteriota bacterium]